MEEVVDLYIDEGFWQSMDGLTKTRPPEVLEVSRTGDSAVTRLRFRLSVELPREAGRFIDPDDVSWVEHTVWDLAAATAEMDFLPDQGAALMKASAAIEVVQTGDDAVRRITGDLRVRIPLLGGKVERAVVGGIGEYLEEEAGVVADHLEP